MVGALQAESRDADDGDGDDDFCDAATANGDASHRFAICREVIAIVSCCCRGRDAIEMLLYPLLLTRLDCRR